MKHRYLVMWHPKLKWGAPIPTLQQSKGFVASAVKLSLTTIRKQGWKWIPVQFETPDDGDRVQEAARLGLIIEDLKAELFDLQAEMSDEERLKWQMMGSN